MSAARSSRCSSQTRRRSSRSTDPASSAFTTTDSHPRHHRGGGVGAVRRGRDQADGAPGVAVRPVVAADREQPGQLALRAGVRLHRDPVVAGRLGQPLLQLVDQLAVARGVLGRRERVQVGEAGHRDRLHLGGGVELHRARPERDHAAVEGVVARREPPQVAQHLRLGAMCREDLVGEVRRLAAQRAGDGVHGRDAEDTSLVRPRRRSARRRTWPAPSVSPTLSPDVVGVDLAQLYAEVARRRDDVGSTTWDPGQHRVEEAVVHDLDAAVAEHRRQQAGVVVDPCSDRRAAPRGRGRRRTSTATTASSTWAVQMLEVALSRRMCCSRVCRARRYAGRPSASTETPTSRPGRCRSSPAATDMKPACGPP